MFKSAKPLAWAFEPGKGLLAGFEAIAVQGYQPGVEQCVSVTSAFLEALPSAAPD